MNRVSCPDGHRGDGADVSGWTHGALFSGDAAIGFSGTSGFEMETGEIEAMARTEVETGSGHWRGRMPLETGYRIRRRGGGHSADRGMEIHGSRRGRVPLRTERPVPISTSISTCERTPDIGRGSTRRKECRAVLVNHLQSTRVAPPICCRSSAIPAFLRARNELRVPSLPSASPVLRVPRVPPRDE
jgi:hypothetical protein